MDVTSPNIMHAIKRSQTAPAAHGLCFIAGRRAHTAAQLAAWLDLALDFNQKAKASKMQNR